MTSRLKYTDQQSTDSQSENSKDKIDLTSPDSNKETSVTGEKNSGATRTSNRNKKQPERFKEAILTNLF